MRLNSFQLKWIAIVTMTIDHMGAILFPGNLIYRYIGRIAFPIFCFLLVEGFFHTRNIQKYVIRLGAFAILSEIPYDLAFRGNILDLERQNVFFTLAIGVGLMYCLDRCSELSVKVIYILLAMWLTITLVTDYSYKGIVLILIYYFLRDRKTEKVALGAAWNFIWNASIQGFGAIASVFIAMYNGEKGKSMKYFFYLFYPLHLLILYGINAIF